MKKLRIIKYKGINLFVLLFALQSLDLTCAWIFHQPKVPEELENFLKQEEEDICD